MDVLSHHREKTLFSKYLLLIPLFVSISVLRAEEIHFVTEELPPFQFTGADNRVDGAIAELVRAMLKETNLSASIHIYPWARSYQTARTRANTIIFSLLRGKQREKDFHWIGKLYSLTSHLAALKSRADIKINKLDDAKQYRVGTVRDDLAEVYLKKKGFISKKNYYASSKYSIMWGQLFNGRVDLAFTNSVLWRYEVKAEGYDPADLVLLYQIEDMASDLYMAASLGTAPSVIDKLSKALEKLKENGQYQAILKKWQL
ncbi:transporter substrate-binding domain-containing protein [Thalassomonas sp. RHCl1]|uniref:substrate-binding periplasmic protein n=1 Tax=Thalassomonas sp. RHCl1 TaxID=2995320 RepID=UPI00248B2100|nr:transporter substrate-binding domain-containing protein [Thalassomonas sp. RHCl1]